MKSILLRTMALAGLVLLTVTAAAKADMPAARIVETRKIWDSDQPVEATDIARWRDQWVCVMQTRAGLQLIGSKDGKSWQSLSTVAAKNSNFPLRAPRLTVTARNRLMLTAVAPKAPCGGYSQTWLSKDGVEWSTPRISAETNYLISSVDWHEGVAYSLQCGSICGSAMTIRIGASEKGQSFRDRFEETFDDWPGRGALVFAQDRGYCVMELCTGQLSTAGPLSGAIGVSKAPYDVWQWKRFPQGLKHPNAIRSNQGLMLVVVAIPDEEGKLRTRLCLLDPPTVTEKPKRKQFGPVTGRWPRVPDAPELVAIGTIPTSQSGFVGLANHKEELWATHHERTSQGSIVKLTRVAFENRESAEAP